MAGYSGTPLSRKLGITNDASVFVVDAPSDYRRLAAPWPEGATLVRALDRADIIHIFATTKSALAAFLKTARKRMQSDAALWVSWPKKSAKVPTDVTEDIIRAVALPLGFVDIKVCAVDDTWSGLKLMIRKQLR